MKLQDVLTTQEREKVAKLKKCISDAPTISDIDYYTKEVQKILDRAEARYLASKQSKNNEQAAALAY